MGDTSGASANQVSGGLFGGVGVGPWIPINYFWGDLGCLDFLVRLIDES